MLLKGKKKWAVYGEGAVTDWMCQKWFVTFWSGDFSLDVAPWSGGPVEVDSSETETLIENNQHYTMWEIADILKICKWINLSVKLRNVSLIIQEKKTTRCTFGSPQCEKKAVTEGGGPLIRDWLCWETEIVHVDSEYSPYQV